MASNWDEAAARARLAEYAAVFGEEGVAQDNYSEWRRRLSVVRDNVGFWSVEDLTHAFAEIDRLRAQVEEFESQSIPDPHRKRHLLEPCHVCKARKGERHGSYCSVLG